MLPVLFFVLLACLPGLIHPYLPHSKRWQFALGAAASFVVLLSLAPNPADTAMQGAGWPPLAPMPFFFLLLACIVGLVHPYIRNSRRWHFALAALASFVGLGATVPKPTPAQVAAQKAEDAREAAQEERQKAATAHETVVTKAGPALNALTNYTRAEFGETYKRVGATTFAKLNELEPGAVYAAAESKACDRVSIAMVSDTSRPGAAVWFADCANENRFMISQADAAAALARFREGKLAPRDLERSCTATSVAYCKLTPAQRIAKEKEHEYLSACDLILQTALVSPSSADLHGWKMSFGGGDKVVIERAFDSQNSFGAMIRGRYRCEIKATTSGITGFVVDGPTGSERIL